MYVVRAALDLSRVVNVDPADAAGALADLPPGDAFDLTNFHVTGWPNIFASAALNARSREQMPVVEPDDAARFTAFLAAEGMESSVIDVDPLALSAGQNELNAVKTADMIEAIAAGDLADDTPPIISADGRVLDGHHRWAAHAVVALTDPTHRMSALKVEARFPDLIKLADEWHAAHGGEGKDITAAIVAHGRLWSLVPLVAATPHVKPRWPKGAKRAGRFARSANRRPQLPAPLK